MKRGIAKPPSACRSGISGNKKHAQSGCRRLQPPFLLEATSYEKDRGLAVLPDSAYHLAGAGPIHRVLSGRGLLFLENHRKMGATIHGVACSACKTHGCDFALEGALSLDGGDTYGYVSQELPPEDFEGPGQRGAGGFGRPHAEKEPVSPDHSPRRGKQPSAGNNPV